MQPNSSQSPNQPGVSPEQAPACLITGAATRVGRHLALAMGDAGWDVAIHYRQSEAEASSLEQSLRSAGRDAARFQADLSSETAVQTLFDAVADRFPRIHCIINSASVFDFDRPEQTNASILLHHYQTNLIAPVLLTERLYRYLKPLHQPGTDPIGVVIHLLDQKLANPNPDFFSYTLAKAALLEATRLAAAAMAPVLRVVGVAPGITLPSGDQTQQEFEQTHAMTVLGASSRPNEVAQAVVWVAQARAVTGTMILVDGGQHLTAQPRDVMMMIRP